MSKLEHLNQKVITVGQNSLHWYLSPGRGATVLFLHDVYSSAHEFEALMTGPLGRLFTCIAVDLPGHGKSANVDSGAVDGVAKVAFLLSQSLSSIGVDECLVVGTGVGAHIALQLQKFMTVSGVMMVGTVPNDAEVTESDLAHLTKVNVNDIVEAYLGSKEKSTESREFVVSAFNSADPSIANSLALDSRREIVLLEEARGNLAPRGQVGVVFGSMDSALCMHKLSSVDGGILWRGSVSVIPGAGHLVATSSPALFSATLAAFVKDIHGTTAPTSQKSQIASSSLKDIPAGLSGQMPNPQARYESAVEDEDDAKGQEKKGPSPQTRNPYGRGKVPGGVMPHPGMRFEIPAQDDGIFKKPAKPNDSIAKNPNARGRVEGGTMPHPGMRFELPADVADTGADDFFMAKSTEAVPKAPTNPNARGRVIGGTMPHPGSRFEVVADSQHPRDAKLQQLQGTQNGDHQAANPFARGRVPGGVMPHPAMRFEPPPHPSDHPIDRPSIKIRQPPGGNQSFTIG